MSIIAMLLKFSLNCVWNVRENLALNTVLKQSKLCHLLQVRLSWRSTGRQEPYRTVCNTHQERIAAARRRDYRPCTNRNLLTLPTQTPSSSIWMSIGANPASTAVTYKALRLHHPHVLAQQQGSHAGQINMPRNPQKDPISILITSGLLFQKCVWAVWRLLRINLQGLTLPWSFLLTMLMAKKMATWLISPQTALLYQRSAPFFHFLTVTHWFLNLFHHCALLKVTKTCLRHFQNHHLECRLNLSIRHHHLSALFCVCLLLSKWVWRIVLKKGQANLPALPEGVLCSQLRVEIPL